MIRINLLPFRAARQRENIRQQVSVFVLLIIFLILGLSYYSIILDKKITKINTDIVRVNNDIAKYKEKANKVVQIKKTIETYERKVSTIKALKSRRREVIVLLDNIAELIIPEKMWLTNLTINKTTVKISGLAFDQKTVADFMTKIGSSPLFNKEVKLNNLKMETLENETAVQKFVLSCTKTVPVTEKKTKS